jgi:hypothetical protein
MSKKKLKREKRMHNIIKEALEEVKPDSPQVETDKKTWLEKFKTEVADAIKRRDTENKG